MNTTDIEVLVKDLFKLRLTQYTEVFRDNKLYSSAYRVAMVKYSQQFDKDDRQYVFDRYNEQELIESKFFNTYNEFIEVDYISKPTHYYGYTVDVGFIYKGKTFNIYVIFKPNNKSKKYQYANEYAPTIEELIDKLINNKFDILLELYNNSYNYKYTEILRGLFQEKMDEYYNLYI